MRRVVVYREKNEPFFFFFHLPALPPIVNPAESTGTAICRAVASGRNCQQHYPPWTTIELELPIPGGNNLQDHPFAKSSRRPSYICIITVPWGSNRMSRRTLTNHV